MRRCPVSSFRCRSSDPRSTAPLPCVSSWCLLVMKRVGGRMPSGGLIAVRSQLYNAAKAKKSPGSGWNSGKINAGDACADVASIRITLPDDLRHVAGPVGGNCGRAIVPAQQQGAASVAPVGACGVEKTPLADHQRPGLHRNIDGVGMLAKQRGVALRRKVALLGMRHEQMIVKRDALHMRAGEDLEAAVLDRRIHEIVRE